MEFRIIFFHRPYLTYSTSYNQNKYMEPNQPLSHSLPSTHSIQKPQNQDHPQYPPHHLTPQTQHQILVGRNKKKLRKKRRKRRIPPEVKVYLANLEKQANWKESLCSGLDLRGPKKPFLKNKTLTKQKAKSYGKLPKNIEITLNLIAGNQRRNCQKKSIDIQIPFSRQLKPEDKPGSNPKLPKITSSTSSRIQGEDDPKTKLITQIKEVSKSRKSNRFSQTNKLSELQQSKIRSINDQPELIYTNETKRQENVKPKLSSSRISHQSTQKIKESQAKQLQSDLVRDQEDQTQIKQKSTSVIKKEMPREEQNQNFKGYYDRRNLLEIELKKAYADKQFPRCHFKILEEMIRKMIGTNTEKGVEYKDKKIKEEIMKIRFLESDVIYLKEAIIQRLQIIEDMRTLVLQNFEDVQQVDTKNKRQIKKQFIMFEKWGKEDKADLQKYIEEYREATLNLIRQVLVWRKNIGQIYEQTTGTKLQCHFTINGKILLSEIGRDLEFTELMSKEASDPFLLSWIKGEDIKPDKLSEIRFNEIILLEQGLKNPDMNAQ